MNFDSIIAFGGSTVAGLELGPDKESPCHELAFPQLVADHFAVTCYNYSWPGGCNDRILRLLPEKLLEHPNSLVLINWTDFSRSEFFYPYCSEDIPADPTGYIQLQINFISEWAPPWLKKIKDFFFKHIYWDSTLHNNYRHYNSLFQAQLICRELSKYYIQIFEMHNIVLEANQGQRAVLEKINFDNVLKFPLQDNFYNEAGWNYGHGNWYDWSRLNNFQFGDCHVLHESHQALANLIIDHIKNENTVGRG
jgi:hypothetical protein